MCQLDQLSNLAGISSDHRAGAATPRAVDHVEDGTFDQDRFVTVAEDRSAPRPAANESSVGTRCSSVAADPMFQSRSAEGRAGTSAPDRARAWRPAAASTSSGKGRADQNDHGWQSDHGIIAEAAMVPAP